MRAKTWHVAVFIDEHEDMTRARVRLQTGDNEMTGCGEACRSAIDRPVPEIGDELAVSRALAELAHRLFEATVADVEANTLTPARIRER